MSILEKSLLALLVLAAGCGTPSPRAPADRFAPVEAKAGSRHMQSLAPRPPRPLPADWQPQTNVVPVAPLPTPTPAAPTPPAATNVPARVVVPPELTWRPLSAWAAERGLAAPRVLAVSPVATYGVSQAGNTMAVTIGSRLAAWNNLELRLGFTPQLVEGEVYVHHLDLLKNFEPLLRPPATVRRARPLVVIDPGHGGANEGTRSVLDGSSEKIYTLDWALRAEPLIEARGWRVLLTRTNDIELSLADRAAFAEAQQADLFVSLHFNASGGGNYQAGIETYCLTPVGMPSHVERGAEDVRQMFPNNAHDAKNLRWSMTFHSALMRSLGATDRGVRRARFPGVLRPQNRPAILIEGGYLSNPEEARNIADPAYRQKLAEALAAGFAN